MAYSTIRSGSKGSDVKTWQEYLKSQGYDVGSSGADGIFGNATLNATKQYQTDKGLTADGIVGTNTWASMNTGNNTNNATQTTNNATKLTAPKGADQAAWDVLTTPYTPDENLSELKAEADSTYDSAKELLGQENIIDPNLKEAYSQKFEVSDSYNQAMEYVNGKLQELMNGKNKWTDKREQFMDDYLNRDKFEYDVDNDQLFQQALASAMNSGKTAMQDTIGQASALTGGYGSTYATTAGNQAYNQFIEDAYNNLPEYYQMALEAYQMEGQDMVNKINMMRDAEMDDFQKTYTQWSAGFENANQIWNKEFQTWDANVNQAFKAADLQLGEYGQRVENLSTLHEMATNRYETEYAKDYQEWADKISQFTGIVDMQTNNYWSQKELDYNYSQLNLEREKFNYSKGDTNNDGVVDGNDIQQSSDYKLTDTEITNIRKIYEENGGGEKGELAVLDYLEQKGKLPSANDMAIVESVYKDVENSGSNTSVKTAAISTGKKGNNFLTKEGDNFDIILNDKEYRVENKGKVTDEKLVKKLNNTGASNKSAFVYDGDIYVKYADAYYKVGATNFLLWETSGYQDILKQLQN